MSPEQRFALAAGATSALIAVAAGAFGAHALRQKLSSDLLAIFETGARYQMYHALALCLLAALAPSLGANAVARVGTAFLLGTVLFSGSLYALALSGVRALGAITPLGGLAFLVGWLLLLAAALKR